MYLGGRQVEEVGTPPMNQPSSPKFDAKATRKHVAAALASRNCNVPWQSPNSRGRKGPAEDPGRVQARGGREVRTRVLHHQLRREECLGLSLRRMGADRREVVAAFNLQSHQKEVPGPNELLRPAGGDGWAGAPLGAAVAA